jgi:putative hydrolase of the HAD superfamily
MEDTLCTIIRSHTKPIEPITTGWHSATCLPRDIRAVLLDVYGTLFVSEKVSCGFSGAKARSKAFREALNAVGIVWHGPESEAADQMSLTISNLHEDARSHGVEYPEVDILEVWQVMLRRFASEGWISAESLGDGQLRRLAVEYECRVNPVWPMPGCRRCLRELHGAGFTLGIISNAQFYTRAVFPTLLGHTPEDLGFTPDLQFYSYRYRQAKESGVLHAEAKEALAKHRIQPEQTVCVGNDLCSDILPARRFGFRTILFAGDRRSFRPYIDEGLFRRNMPDTIITSLSELSQFLTESSASRTLSSD